MSLILELANTVGTALDTKELKLLTNSFETSFPALTQHTFTIEVHFFDENEMQTLNREQRSKDKPTDVLSFPLFTSQSAWEGFGQPEALLGTIVICPTYAAAQGTPLLDLVHHGILHVLGFDHETDIATWRMQEHGIVEKAQQQGLLIHGIPDDL
jgi:probable rRNA maturation factor